MSMNTEYYWTNINTDRSKHNLKDEPGHMPAFKSPQELDSQEGRKSMIRREKSHDEDAANRALPRRRRWKCL
jgi:hypothetical protein